MAKEKEDKKSSNGSWNEPVASQDDPTPRTHEPKKPLSIFRKLCYAIGGAPYQITGSALGFFLQMFLLNVAQLNPIYASLILFMGRAWDAITDPMVGFLVSRTPWTRFGRMLPWILLSTPLAVLSYFFIWYVPPFEYGKVIWYLLFYCIFQSLQTCFHVPYSALTMFISSDQKERDSATAYRMMVELLGTVVGTAIQGQILGMANAPCIPGPRDIVANLNISSLNVNGSESAISLVHTKNAYMIASGVISIIYVMCASVLFLGVKEQKPSSQPVSEHIGLLQGIKLVMGYGPYVKLILVFLFTSLAFMLLEGNFALFCTYTLGFQNDFQNILLVVMLSATLTIPLWQCFLTRFGKKTSVYVGNLSVVPFMILIVCMKSTLIMTYIFAIAAGVGVASAFMLPWSMLPDVLDDFQVQHPSSYGHEALFYSFYVFFTKFASGVSLGISTLCLGFAGYITRGCSQPEAVDVTLKVLVSAAPIACIIVGLVILFFYPINEERRQSNRRMLEQPDIMDDSDWSDIV